MVQALLLSEMIETDKLFLLVQIHSILNGSYSHFEALPRNAVPIVKEAFDISFDNVIDRVVLSSLTQSLEGILTASGRTEPIRISYEIMLVNGFQYSDNPILNKFVFKARYP
jgi:hypothetical protein